MTRRRVLESTDGKYIGLVFDDEQPVISPDGVLMAPTKIQDLGDGKVRYSNSNYVLLTEVAE